MINSKDLRIGNIVLEDGIISKYDFIEQMAYTNFEKYCNHLQPINLTPEILEQCGAIKINNAEFEFNDGVIITHSGDFKFYLTYYYDDGRGEKSLGKVFYEYLHEMQNLHKILQGTELPININTLKV